jgi:hypothetical protein
MQLCWLFSLALSSSTDPLPHLTWISCFMSVCYGIYCLGENVFCHLWVEEVFMPVVHLIVNLNVINPVAYRPLLKCLLGQRFWFLRILHFSLVLYSVIIPTPVQFATFFGCSLRGNLWWLFLIVHVLVSLYLPECKTTLKTNPPPPK